MFMYAPKPCPTRVPGACHAATASVGGLSDVCWTLVTCSSVGGIRRLPHQVQAAGHLHSSQWRPRSASAARALFSRPVICLSGKQNLPRAPVISESPGSSQNVSEGGLKTLTIWWTSQAGAASSSHRATLGFNFPFIAPCLSSNTFICCCFPLTASSEYSLMSKV
jgi:hypothetical protein